MEKTAPLKILFIDDEPGIVKELQEIFSRRGLVSFAATDSATAIEIFEKEKPQICFIDFWMAGGVYEGLEVLKRIKIIEKDTYCLMMGTCSDKDDAVKKAMELGALHFFRKPVPLKELDNYVEEIKGLMLKKHSSSIRELFHDLGNKLNMITLGVGAVEVFVEDYLNKDNNIPQASKEKILDSFKDLDRIVSFSKEADKKTRDIEEKVYNIIDPDTGEPK